MKNTYSKANNENKQQEPVVNNVPVKMPKNIRQIGNIGSRNKVIYVEDYVMTYIKQLSEKDYADCRVAILLGYYIKSDQNKNLFIKGAIEMKHADFNNEVPFSDESWTNIYETIKNYFTDVEIVGWCLIGTDFLLENVEKIRRIHLNNFSGADKALLKVNNMEKEEAFYLSENNQLVKQSGYYIYYEKNEEMQNYMVENKESVNEEKIYDDKTTQKIRTIIKEKKETKDDKSLVRLLYAASSLLAIMVIVIAAIMLNSNGQLKTMQNAIDTLAQNINKLTTNTTQVAEEDQTIDEDQSADTNETVSTDQSTDEKQTAAVSPTAPVSQTTVADAENSRDESATVEEQETMEVETISGNIVKQETDSNTTDESETTNNTDTNQDKTSDNSKTADEEDANASDSDTDNTKTATEDATDTDKSEDEAAQTSKEVRYYIVEAGDSLAGISYKLYKSVNYVNKIQELNGIEDENKIYEGQKLIVP